jgi:hypothetical protein
MILKPIFRASVKWLFYVVRPYCAHNVTKIIYTVEALGGFEDETYCKVDTHGLLQWLKFIHFRAKSQQEDLNCHLFGIFNFLKNMGST